MSERAKGCQFRGVPAALRALESCEVPKWALFYNKAMLEKYEGDDINESRNVFREYMKALERNTEQNAIYTLCTYEDLKKGVKIKPSTECDRSFNFTVFDQDEYQSPYRRSVNESTMTMQKQIDDLKAQISGDDHEDEEKVSGVGTWLVKLLDNPEVQRKIGSVFSNLIDKIVPMVTEGAARGAESIGNVPAQNEAEQIAKINNAVQELFSVDPKLGDHLEKVAMIAKTNPQKYSMLISML